MQRGRSASPSRMRGRSNSPSRLRGRSNSPSRMAGAASRSRSGSPSRLRGRSNSPSRLSMAGTRSRSGSPSRLRGRSNSPSRYSMAASRSRSGSPARMRGRSNSPSRQRGRSNSPGGRSRASLSPSEQRVRGRGRLGGRFRRGRKRRTKSEGALPESGDHRRRKFRMAPKRLTRSVRRIAPKESCPCWKIFSYIIPIVIMVASAAGLIVATGNAGQITPTFVENWIPRLKNEELVDPFSGVGTGTSSGATTSVRKWDNGGDNNGLTIEILNALTVSWDSFFSVAVTDWENGNPDALSLATEKVTEDQLCAPVAGKIKICNGDYGETKWRGINDYLVNDGGFYIHATARMNEFYLVHEGDDAKQYTMCHEMGHAFGLLHTDEIFDNEDLGNCLDYTNNFEGNKHPDVTNYESLLALYGPVGGRRRQRWLRSSSPTNVESSSSSSVRVAQKERELSPSLWQTMRDAVQKLAARMDDNAHEDGWKLLYRTRHGEEHELEFEGGYKVRVHMLLA